MVRTILLSIVSLIGLPLVCNADPITPEKAAQLAAKYIRNNAQQPRLVKSGARKKSAARLSRQAQQSSPYYIFSRGEDCGFVIVSGDDALPEVLGYTEGGNYDEADMPPFLAWYLDYYGSAVEAAQAAGAPRMDAPAMAAAAGRVDIAPLIQTHWHQTAPYNDKCPTRKDGGGRCLTGCVATAASQVLYYWHKDLTSETLAATSSYIYGDQMNATTAFPKGTKIKWDLMRTQYSSEPAEYRDAVATLLAVVGGGAGLTYGSSTAGYNDNCRWVFSSVFGMNGGKENNKDWGEEYNNYSDDAWATLLYNELINSRPVLYSGCNSNNEGHAVVVDGYQASTGYFHFNLGWGDPNTWDGYFTVARGKSPAWQGYNAAWQECVTGVYPKKQNMSAELFVRPKFYFNRDNEVSIDIQNKGTLDYKGIYVFTNTNGAAPKKLTDAKASDTETVLPNTGETVTVTLPVHPTTSGRCFVIVTDANLNVLAKTETEALVPDANLDLTDMMIDGSSETEVHTGNDYTVVYNNKASAVVTFADKSGLGYEGSPRLAIYESTDDGQTFSYVGYKSAKLSVEPNATTDVTFSLTSTTSCPISIGNLYYATLINPIVGTKTDDVVNMDAASDTIVRFILKGSDLNVESYEDGCLKLAGTWDVNAFITLTKKSAYKNATNYDLTAVTKIGQLPVVEKNPNALFYVASDAMPTGNNYVKDGVCYNLKVQPGYDFMPRADMKATTATIDINQQPSSWYILTVPFDVDVPQGIIARQIDTHASSGISGKTTDLKRLEAGHAYLVMTSSTHRQQLVGHDVNVSKVALANADTALVGTFVNTSTPAGAMLIGSAEPQYFEPAAESTAIEAMRGYFHALNVTRSFRAYSQLASDPTFLVLSKNIEAAYEALDSKGRFASGEMIDSLTALIDSAEIIFADRTYTTAQARMAYVALEEAVAKFLTGAIDPDMPVDCTAAIVNPSFETGRTTGWETDGTIQNATNLVYKSVDADGKYYLYSCHKDSTSSELSQTITGLTPGRYRLSAMLGSTEGHTITLFAADTTVTVNAHHLGVHYLVKAVIDDVEVGESGELTIGVKAGFFYKADDFRLTLLKAAEEKQAEDVNADGVVDTQDVLKIYEYIQNAGDAADAYDVNGDGVVDTQDVLKVYEYIQQN